MVVEYAWGDRVLNVRLKLRLTQKQMAAKAGLSPDTIAKWEMMKRRPYSAEAEWFMRIEKAVEEMTSEEAEHWLGPQEPELGEV